MSSRGEANGEGSPPPLLLPHPSLLFAFYQLWHGLADKQKRWPRFKSSRRCGSGGHLGAHLGAAVLLLMQCRGRGPGGQGLAARGVAKEGWQGGHMWGAHEWGGQVRVSLSKTRVWLWGQM